MSTSFKVSFGPNALTIKSDAEFSGGNPQSFVNYEDLKIGIVASKPYASYEPDFWKLDGNYKFKPSLNARAGYISASMSDGTGDLGSYPNIVISMTDTYSTNGMTLYFSSFTGDWVDSLQIRYFGPSGLIRTDNYTPADVVFSTNQPVVDFNFIEITLITTNKPFRYARIQGIDFDTLITFEGNQIKQANLVEQIDPTALTLPYNVLDFVVFSEDAGFSIVSPSSDYLALQEKTPMDAYEDIDGVLTYLGRFYLESWESLSDNQAKFRAFDALGLMDSITCVGGIYYVDAVFTGNNKQSHQLIDEIEVYSNIVIDLDPSLVGIQMYGWIPYGTCRSALQLICLSIGAYATTNRSGGVVVRPIEFAADLAVYDSTIPSARKSLESPLTLRPLYTRVEVLAHNYTFQTNPNYVIRTIFDEDVTVGDHLIIFGEPIYSLGYGTGSTVTATYTFGDNHLIAHVTVAGHLRVTGYQYVDGQKFYNAEDTSLDPDTPQKVIKVERPTLIADNNGQLIADRLLYYHQQRFLQRTKLFAPSEVVGDAVLVDTQGGEQLKGIIEKMNTDLAGGFVSRLDIVGVIA